MPVPCKSYTHWANKVRAVCVPPLYRFWRFALDPAWVHHARSAVVMMLGKVILCGRWSQNAFAVWIPHNTNPPTPNPAAGLIHVVLHEADDTIYYRAVLPNIGFCVDCVPGGCHRAGRWWKNEGAHNSTAESADEARTKHRGYQAPSETIMAKIETIQEMKS